MRVFHLFLNSTQQEKIQNSEELISDFGFPLRIPNLFWKRIFGSVLRKPSVHYQYSAVECRYTTRRVLSCTSRRIPLVHYQKSYIGTLLEEFNRYTSRRVISVHYQKSYIGKLLEEFNRYATRRVPLVHLQKY